MPFDGEHLKQIIAVTMVFGTPIVIVVAVLIYRLRRARELHATIRELAARGLPIPPELFDEGSSMSPRSMLRYGVTLVAVGIGLIVMFVTQGEADNWGVGAIPLAVGIGYLVLWRLENRAPG